MFIKEKRLKKTADFNRLKTSKRIHLTPFFKIVVEQNGPNLPSRFGFIVSANVAKAAERNRIKRRLREASRVVSPKIRNPYDILIIGRLSALDVQFKELILEMEKGFKRLGLIDEKASDPPPDLNKNDQPEKK